MRFSTLIDNEQFYTNTFENPYEIDKSLDYKLHVNKEFSSSIFNYWLHSI